MASLFAPPLVRMRYCVGAVLLLALSVAAAAHDVAEGDKAFVQGVEGAAFMPFLYLGAKHMVTGYDHVLFLIGVVFYLQRLRDVALYVSLFTLGHSLTLLGGVMLGLGVNAYVVDAIIGLSVVYKGVENLGGFGKIGVAIDPRLAVFAFGLVHGTGLATKVLDLQMADDGKVPNLLAFNLGVELGQLLVLSAVVGILSLWRATPSFQKSAVAVNIGLVIAGLLLTTYQAIGYFSA